MITFETSVRVECPIEEVFAFVSDPLLFPRWNSAVQAVDDTQNRVLASASELETALKEAVAGKPKKERARIVGKVIGEKLIARGVTSVVFDRNGFIYHGRVKEVADGARDAGLAF